MFQNRAYFKTGNVKTFNGKVSLAILGSKIWELSLKGLTNIKTFKQIIKHWVTSACPCGNCRTYIKRFRSRIDYLSNSTFL